MAQHFDPFATDTAAVLLKRGGRYSADEVDAALAAARTAIQWCFEEIHAERAGRPLMEAIDAARSVARNRA